jgi:hypothetical protein
MDDLWVYPLRQGEMVADQDWIPLHFHRLLGSDFVADSCARGVEGRAALGTALLLWAESVKQDPGGTLPESDVALARLAGFGPDVSGWRAVRSEALHGWTSCVVEDRDGVHMRRLGHRLIAEACLFAWNRKNGRKVGREAARVANVRWKVREKMKALRKPERLVKDDMLVGQIADWLIQSGMSVTLDNVASGLARAGVPTLVRSLENE